MERWRQVPIAEYKDLYEVSDRGRIYSVRSKKCLMPKISKAGYYYITLANHGKFKAMRIHRLVAMAFIPNPENKPTVNHINENKLDNRLENLEWATIAEQNIHGTRIARAVANTDYKNRGIDYKQVAAHHDYLKQNMCGRKKCKVWYISGNEPIYMGEFPSQKAAAEFTGVSQGKVSQCCLGQKKTCKGYVFEEFPIQVTKKHFSDTV